MNRLAASLAVLTLGLLIGADGAQEDQLKKEKQKLEGTWTVEQMQVWGQQAPEAEIKGTFSWIIEGETLTTKGRDDEKPNPTKGKVRIDPTKKPKTIDVTLAKAEKKGSSILGIYELEGDTLRICHAMEGGNRPAEFSSTVENKQGIVIFKRQKP